MRIYNRSYEAITRARQNRIAKTRVWSGHTKNKTGLSRATGAQAKSRGVTSKSGGLLQQILNKLNQSADTTSGQLAASQSKCYDYGVAEVAAKRVAKHMDRFLTEGENSLYGADQKARETLEQEIMSFVDDYNITVKKLNSIGSSTDEMQVKYLKKEFTDREMTLKRIGITVNANGTISLNRNNLKEAETDTIQKIFGAKDGISAKLKALALTVETSARKQAEALKKASYTTSSNYSRYASDDNVYGTAGRRYNAKG